MKLQIFPSTGSLIPVDIDDTQLTNETLNTVFSNAGIEVSSNMVVTFGFRTPEGAINRGTFDTNTTLSADVITLSISMRETKAASSETDEVIEIAKQALISQTYQDLKSACRQLRTINEEVKAIIGDYTHMSNSQLVQVIEKAIEFLSPVTEVTDGVLELIQKIETKVNRVMEVVETFETRIQYLENKPASNNSEVEALRSDLAYVANHFKIALPEHPDLFEGF
jgi:FtsZ-binding cell division protein ZapB